MDIVYPKNSKFLTYLDEHDLNDLDENVIYDSNI